MHRQSPELRGPTWAASTGRIGGLVAAAVVSAALAMTASAMPWFAKAAEASESQPAQEQVVRDPARPGATGDTNANRGQDGLGLVCRAAARPDLTVEISVSTLDAGASIGILRNGTVHVGTVIHSGIVVDDVAPAGKHTYTAIVHGSDQRSECGIVKVFPFACNVEPAPSATPHSGSSADDGPAAAIQLFSAGSEPNPPGAMWRNTEVNLQGEFIGWTESGGTSFHDDVPAIWFWSPWDSERRPAHYAWFVDSDWVECGSIEPTAAACWLTFDAKGKGIVHVHPDVADLNVIDFARWSGGQAEVDFDWVPGQLEYVDEGAGDADDFTYLVVARSQIGPAPMSEFEFFGCLPGVTFD